MQQEPNKQLENKPELTVPAYWTEAALQLVTPPSAPAPKKSYFSFLGAETETKLRSTASHTFKGFLEGFSLQTILAPLTFSGPVTNVYWEAMSRNAAYLGLAMASDFLNDLLIKQINNDDQCEAQTSYSAMAINTGFFAVNSLIMIRFLLSSTVDNMSIASAMRKENLEHLEKYKCECEFKPSLPGVLNDPITNIFGILRLTQLSLIPVVGRPAAAIYGSILYGNALIQMRLSKCLSHRREYITQHIFSVLGYGAAMLTLTQLLYLAQNYYTDRDGTLVYDAIFTLVYQLFIGHSINSTLDFPADLYTFDPAYLDGPAVAVYLSDLNPLIASAFSGNNPPIIPMDKVMKVLQSRILRTWSRIDIRSLDQFFENPSVRLLVKMIQPTLMEAIDGIKDIPKNKGVKIGKRLEKWLKPLGVKSEGLDLARTIWDIQKKGYFNPEFLEPIRVSINKAAGLKPSDTAIPGSREKDNPGTIVLEQPDHVFKEEQKDEKPEASIEIEPNKPRRRVAILPHVENETGKVFQIIEDHIKDGSSSSATLVRQYNPSKTAPPTFRTDRHGKPLFPTVTDHSKDSQSKSEKPSGR